MHAPFSAPTCTLETYSRVSALFFFVSLSSRDPRTQAGWQTVSLHRLPPPVWHMATKPVKYTSSLSKIWRKWHTVEHVCMHLINKHFGPDSLILRQRQAQLSYSSLPTITDRREKIVNYHPVCVCVFKRVYASVHVCVLSPKKLPGALYLSGNTSVIPPACA